MRSVNKDELIATLIKENQELKHQALAAKSDIDYVAMMTGVEIDIEGDNENEQI